MNRIDRRSALVWMGLSLTAAAHAPQALATPRPPEKKNGKLTRESDAVQTYLHAYATRDWGKGYRLLSAATRQRISPESFQLKKDLPSDPTADGMTATLTAVSALFIDASHSLGYKYRVMGPADPTTVVLVEALPPGKLPKDPLRLRIVTVNDPKLGPCLDMLMSMQQSDPAGYQKMIQWAIDEAKH